MSPVEAIAEPPAAPAREPEPDSVAVERPEMFGRTAGQIASSLGVSANRIVIRPTPGMATREDWIRCVETKSPLCELIDGTLVEKLVGYEEGRFESVLTIFFGMAEVRLAELRGTEDEIYAITGGSGAIASGANGRLPDVSVVDVAALSDEYTAVGPTPILAVEVLSPGNTKKEMAIKRAELFAAGLKEMWIADPQLRQVEVWTSSNQMLLVEETGTLDASVCFPNLKVPVAAWMNRTLNRQSAPLLEAMTAQ